MLLKNLCDYCNKYTHPEQGTLRAYPNNRVVMRPSEKFEAKAAQISPYQHAETSKAEAKRRSSTYSVSAGQNSMLELSTRVGNERHSEPRPIHTVLAKCTSSPNQQGTSCILLNSGDTILNSSRSLRPKAPQ